MKSFLTNNPDVKLALNEDLVLGKAGDVYGGNGGMGVVLDDCNFHTAVRMDDFDIDRTLSLVSCVRIRAPVLREASETPTTV
jgi:AP-4 complex subunit mu-1